MKKSVLIFLLCLLGLAGFCLLATGCAKEQTKGALAQTETDQHQPEQPVERPSIEAFGVVKGTEAMSVNFDFSARVKEIYVKVGQRVTLGEPLLSLDVDVHRAEILNTEYELNLARFELRKEEIALQQLREEIAEKEQRLAENTDYEIKRLLMDLEKTERELEKKRRLLAKEAIPRSEVEDLEKNLFDLKLSLAHLRQEKKEEIEDLRTELMLKSAPSETAPLETPKPASSYSSIQMQRAKIALLEEKLSILKKQLNQSFIRNDQVICNFANGVVAEINYAEGDLFFIEKKAMTIINLDSLVIEANIGEDFIKDVKIGADVLISPVADYSRTYRGKITRLSELAVVENGETVIPVEISFEQHDNFLLPNFNVDVKIYTD